MRLNRNSAYVALLFVALAWLGMPAIAHAAEATLIADAHVSSVRPSVNSGAISNLAVGGGYTSLLQFDLSLLPTGTTSAQISRAVLRIYCNRVDTTGLISVQAIGGAWGEYSVTYATMPSLGSAVQVFPVTQAGTYLAVDVTSLVQGWVASPKTNSGLALTAGTASVQFDSKENDLTAHPPSLDITLATQGQTGATGAAGATGATGSAGPKGDPGPAGPQGPTGGISYKGAYSSATNYGLNDIVTSSGSSYVSLASPNRGNTPGQVPSAWGLLASAGTGSSGGGANGSVGVAYQGTYSSTSNYGLNDIVTYLGSSYISLISTNHGNTPSFSPGQWGMLAQGGEGVVGPTGPAGTKGDTGATGSPGLGYLGVYQSATNYGLSDVVGYGGSSYISLITGNHGNTPGLSPTAWGLVAKAGDAGPVGSAGSAGAVGSTGPAGLQGPTGPQGPAGATGAAGLQGLPGLVYQGPYASTTNYKLGDVVLWQGTSYTSLSEGNHGNTPGLSPGQWGLLSAQGPAGSPGSQGPQGVAGPQGLPGSIGPAGERGDQGLQGIPGQAGAQGLTGAAGPTGLQGPMGPQGQAGPVGLNPRGPYDSTINYGLGDGVVFGGSSYVSLAAGNQGHTPDGSPAQWAMFAAAGAQGIAGPAGPTGVQGPAGVTGATGAQGLTGATGATGAQGPAAANFIGSYSAATSYALRDAVLYNGSTYVSLVDNNHGQPPDQSPSQWTLIAARGVTGPIGPAGPTGAAGSTGATGAAGPAGAQGPPISFLGGWLTSRTYAVGDGISYGGSSYVALTQNSGRQPDVSPTFWAILAQAGAAGPAGPTGLQGQQGPSGFAGPQGPSGPQGATGATGIAGPAGATGPAGPSGLAGPTGATGATGITFRGAYSTTVNYAPGDLVTYAGSSYLSVATGTSNQGNQPDLSSQAWSLLAAAGSQGAAGQAGATGATGVQGMQGPAGPVGADGARGADGAAGTPGLVYRGTYASSANYALNDAVVFGGSSYISLSASNRGNAPDQSPSWWGLLAQTGSIGPQGATGAAGANGSPGAPGANGAQGATGATGQVGAPGIIYRGAWTSNAGYQTNDAVSYNGGSYIAQMSNSASAPDVYPAVWAVLAQKGDAGPTGPGGASASVSVGTVTTGAPGSTATVTNVGTNSAAVLNFVIPQGAAGTAGTGGASGGGAGTSGIAYQSMYHAVSYNSSFYSVNNPNSSGSETPAVLTWVPGACTATTLSVYSQQMNTITVKLRTGLPGSMTDSSLACSAASNGSCTATGSISVPGGSFVDLSISGANGNQAGVWTALACS